MWEYLNVVYNVEEFRAYPSLLKEHGSNGWEVCGLTVDRGVIFVILKRPLPGGMVPA